MIYAKFIIIKVNSKNMMKQLIIILIGILSGYCSWVCKICQFSVNSTAKVLSVITPNFVAIEILDALCMRKCKNCIQFRWFAKIM